MRTYLRLTLLAAVLLQTVPAAAQEPMFPDVLLQRLPWRNIGPSTMGGRIDEFAVAESKPGTMYVATATGGVLKSENYGTTWKSVFEDQSNTTIGAVSIAPSDINVVWVGSGEANNRQSSSWGDGVYRSTDAGKTWKHVGLEKSFAINRIKVHPTDPKTAYVAALGNLWAPGGERGLYKTTDGGETWSKSLYINEDTGVTDVVLDPTNPNNLIAAAYQRRRTPSGFNGGGPGSGIYKSTDAGATWTKITAGLPSGDIGRIGLGQSRKNPMINYAVLENAAGGVFRTDDGGSTWKKVNPLDPRPMYYSNIHVDPTNPDKLWLLSVNLYYSSDGGKNFRTIPIQKIHSDFHAFWIDPTNPNHVLAGCDGGIWWSNDLGSTWDHYNNIPLGQFYEVAYDMKKPYWVFGGLQDNYSWGGPSASMGTEGVGVEDWVNIGGGDGFYNAVDPMDSNVVYQESQNGGITRINMSTGERKGIRPRPLPGEPAYKFDWNSPIVISPHNHNRIYIGGNRLFISDERGDNWQRTDDLSAHIDRDKLQIMGVVPDTKTLSLNDGQDSYGQIITISESPIKAGVLWVGTDDGNVQLSQDAGATWKNVVANVPGVPKNTYVVRLVASKYAVGRCYACFDGHRTGDLKPYLFVTDDFGATWKSLSNGIPEGSTLHVVREHHKSSNLLFAGTERGLYVSFNAGEKWKLAGAPLPTVPVDDIQIHRRDNDLILATHGRSFYILDDISAWEKLSMSGPSENQLIQPRTTVAYRVIGKKGFIGDKPFYAPNPPAGAIIHYWLAKVPAEGEKAKLTILTDNGKTIVSDLRQFGRQPGLNRVIWDLRYGASTPDSAPGAGGGGGGRRFRGARGPRVLPGNYIVRLTIGKAILEQKFAVEEDPRLTLTKSEREDQFKLLMRLNSISAMATDTRNAIDSLKEEVDALEGKDEFKRATTPELTSLVNRTKEKTTELQSRIAGKPVVRTKPAPKVPEDARTPAATASKGLSPAPAPPTIALTSRISSLIFGVDAITEAPSPSAKTSTKALEGEVKKISNDTNDLIRGDAAKLNQLLTDAKLKPIIMPVRVTSNPWTGDQVVKVDALPVDDGDDDQ
ncbi:MAG: glycosyl hydrolase [Chthonomonadales bacterium]